MAPGQFVLLTFQAIDLLIEVARVRARARSRARARARLGTRLGTKARATVCAFLVQGGDLLP